MPPLGPSAVSLLLFSSLVHCEPLTIGVSLGAALATGAFFGGYNYLKCKVYECCDHRWIRPNFTGMTSVLNRRLYGQHLVPMTVVSAIRAHWDPKVQPRKALVLSFHGWTGGGKNYVSSIVVEHLFAKGSDSRFLHFFVGGLHFPHSGDSTDYQRQLRSWIVGNVTDCQLSVFIFDEADKMPVKVLDTIKPFVDHHVHLNGVDFRRTIFILLSNTGGNDITRRTLEYFEAGQPREKLTLHEMEQIITMAAYNEQGGLRSSSLINKHLIDHFVPFLPLEREHIFLCIRDYLQSRGYQPTNELAVKIADSLQYFPSTAKIYAAAGCKRIPQKTELILQSERGTYDEFFRDEL